MKPILQVLVLLLLSQCVFAQQKSMEIHGMVLDGNTSEPLEGALIKADEPGAGAVTRSDGKFTLTTRSKTLVVQYTGYEKRTVELPQKATQKEGEIVILEVKLFPLEELLSQVVVSANKRSQRITETTVSIESIKPYLVENKNPPTMEGIIDQIPSANITDGQVNIRGGSGWSYGSGSRVMVLVDGLPMLSGDAGSVQWSFITMENIKNIEVLKGASSVLFGSAALNGIINIQTKSPSAKPETQITQFYGVYDQLKRGGLHWQGDRLLSTGGFRAVHSFKKKAHEWVFTTNLFNDDGYRMGDFERRARVGVNYRWVPEGKNLILGMNSSVQKGSSASFLLWQSYDSAFTSLNNAITQTNSTRFNFDPSIIWYSGKTRHSLRSRYLYIDNQVDNGNPLNNQSNRSNMVYTEYQTEIKGLPYGIKLTSGLVHSITLTSSPLFQGDQRSTNAALYVQSEKKWNRLLINAGARLEHYGLNDYKENKPVFRSGMNYELAKFTFLRASFGQGYRFPTISESYISTTVGPMKIFPNSTLKSETGWNAELGAKQGFKIGKVKGFTDLAFFWTQYKDMMEFTFGQWSSDISPMNGFGAGFKSINTGPSRIRGIEFSTNGEGKIGKGEILFLAGYTFMDSKSLMPDLLLMKDSVGNDVTFRNTSSDTFNNALKYRPKHLLKADIQYQRNKWNIGVSLRYTSYMENIDAAFVRFPLDLFIKGIQQGREANLKGAMVFDLRTGYELNKFLKLNVVITNLLNKEYMVRPADIQAPRSFSLQMIGKF